ncbi:MAG TPA: hypothetical protein VM925_11450, partial [Labilithrix sp.]|nr:hypothetical protein [Labilithrix sp.]
AAWTPRKRTLAPHPPSPARLGTRPLSRAPDHATRSAAMRIERGHIRVGLHAIALAALVGCGRSSSPTDPVGPTAKTGSAPPSSRVDATVPGDGVPSLDELALRGPTDMPLMREAARSGDLATALEVRASASDTCFRAVVAASEPIRSWFEDETRSPRGAELSGVSGLVPPRGPACARKGETLRLVVSRTTKSATARTVIWQAP